jgi:hypothetical protein
MLDNACIVALGFDRGGPSHREAATQMARSKRTRSCQSGARRKMCKDD